MTKEKNRKWEIILKILKIIWRILGTICILAVPAVSFFAFEYITGNLEMIREEQSLSNRQNPGDADKIGISGVALWRLALKWL